MLLVWVVILALIGVNALYVAAEFAAVGVRRSRLRRLAEDGSGLARQMLPVVEDGRQLDRYVAACQIGITLSSLVLGAFGQATLPPVVRPWLERAGIEVLGAQSASALLVLVGLTSLQVVMGELVPKSLALQFPTRTALATVLPLRWSLKLFSPAIKLLNGSGVFLLRVFGVRNTGHRHIHSPEELELLIAESRDGGLLEPEEQVRLHRALRLGLRTAGQLMVPRSALAAVDADLPLPDVLRIIASSAYTRLPAYRGSLDHVVGVIWTKDVVVHWVTQGDTGSVEPLLHPIGRVREDLPADRLLAFLREQRSHQALVVDDAGRTSGLVTLGDVLAHLLGPAPDELKPARQEAVGG
jgi:putative hemolysin